MEPGHCSGENKGVRQTPSHTTVLGHTPVAVCHAAPGTLGPEAGSTAIATQKSRCLCWSASWKILPAHAAILQEGCHQPPLGSSSRARRHGCCDWVGPSAYPEGRPQSLTSLPGVAGTWQRPTAFIALSVVGKITPQGTGAHRMAPWKWRGEGKSCYKATVEGQREDE